jgi:general secretion pathway protein A
MYLDYYGFKEKPFTITPNPRFIFLSKNHKEVFAHLLYGVQHHAGFIEVTGEVGTGKTTVLRTLLNQLDEESYRVALILNPCLSSYELLRTISREFGVAGEESTIADLLENLNRFLLEQHRQGRTVVLVIDEAQNLDPQVLEQIRLLSNLETETDKLIQIVLVGQPELGLLLEKPELRQLSQRVTVRYHLRPMDFNDTRSYIEHRLEIAGFPRAAVFTEGALKKIFTFSGGYPRLINIVCDRALLIGYTEGRREISVKMISTAIREIRRDTRKRWTFRTAWVVAIGAGILLLGAGFYLGTVRQPVRPVPETIVATSATASAAGPTAPETSSLRQELAHTPENENTIQTFNAVGRLWGARPVLNYQGKLAPSLDRLAERRQLRLLRVGGALNDLLLLDSPALLEVNLSKYEGKRYLAITGITGNQVTITPTLAGRSTISRDELTTLWSGQGYIPWRNYEEIPDIATPGTSGTKVTRLQQLLTAAEVYQGRPSGVFDQGTIGAIEQFQKRRGVPVDGRVGEHTLLLLYQTGTFNVPRLTAKTAGGAPL